VVNPECIEQRAISSYPRACKTNVKHITPLSNYGAPSGAIRVVGCNSMKRRRLAAKQPLARNRGNRDG
jgi:hypothetical protein